ncbi:DUF7527 domain-containing protein [Halobaculum lipolyticum]|uniref:DUF7527 domain-containing protein n=1 Tax=Halobaculum lipolyticum TaxID=3032001 RepID=UPI0024C37576|nr:hypothetical protein [Halobaculum sp. DT31]
MDGETIDTVTGWESEPLSGGIDGLRTLQSRDFTGAVTEGHAWLFVLNGRIVGVFDGSLDSFADADGTAYTAPDPSFPLLYAMRETGGETKARYYTNDTALSAADAKLTAGKFTGYIELSENVLSGDYYAVYYGGRRLACAFVGTGQQKQVLTGDEAFEAADDEVGIYEVVDVDIEVVDLPEPEEPDTGSDAAAGAGIAEAETDPAAADSDADADATADPTDGITFGGGAGETGAAATAGDDASTGGPAESGTAAVTADETVADEDPVAADDAADPDDAPAVDAPSAVAEPDTRPPADEPNGTDDDGAVADATATDRTDSVEADGEERPETDADGRPKTDANGDPFSAEEQWRETRAIPSLDPSRTATPEGTAPADNGAGAAARARRRRSRDDDAGRRESTGGDATAEPSATSRSSGSTEPSGASASTGGEAADTAEAAAASEQLATARAERDRAVEALNEARERLDAAEGDLARLREENGRLESRVEELESALADAREEAAAAESRADAAAAGDDDGDATPSRTVPADRALSGTNLFVRYDSKGGATLEKAHAGGGSRSEVNDNLRLELHTDFESEDAAVDGRPYREFLTDTIEYGFVEWVVRELLYEIQSTGNESALRDLFDAIPEIDRAELNGSVTLEGEEGASEHAFDVVLRDRMGNPLLVADVTEGRDATTESMLDGLVGEASSVADADEHLAAGFYVTASFFEPGALEAAADATGGGLLSRGKRKSFVKLSRKQGFHLCLVESRDGEFHVNVPEL